MKLKISSLILLFILSTNAWAQVPERFRDKGSKNDTIQAEEESGTEREKVSSVKPVQSKSEESNFWDKVVFGGNASLSIGTYTLIHLSPSMGYKFRENFIAGAGFIYQYAKINQAYDLNSGRYVQVDGYENQIYGPKVFTNYFPVDFLYIGSQFEYLNHDVGLYDFSTSQFYVQNQWTPVLFLEGGYAQPLGNKGYVQLGLRFNVLHDFDSPYGSSWFPVIGFFF